MPAHHGDRRRRAAAVRNVSHVDLRALPEQFPGDATAADDARHRPRQFRGARAGQRHQLLHRPHRQRGMGADDERIRREPRDAGEILRRVVGQLRVGRRVHGEARGHERDRTNQNINHTKPIKPIMMKAQSQPQFF